jgi:hypothetical protein
MLIENHPPASALFRDTAADSRFWYWRGASGQRYIHSVYPANACPPLPGAIYVAVRRTGTLRTALTTGRFSVFWELSAEAQVAAAMADVGADEIHVHLLAGSEERAQAILADLQRAMFPGDVAGQQFPGTTHSLGLAA